MIIIGGKSDGNQIPLRTPTLELDGEQYLLVSYREKDAVHQFYMLAGMTPEAAQAKYRIRKGTGK